MGIKTPTIKSEYLNHGEGATIEKVKVITELSNFIIGIDDKNVKITILEWGNKIERKLTDFTPNEVSSNGKIDTIEYIDNLLYTMELNPPEEVIITLPSGAEFFVYSMDESNDILDECYDVTDKLRDVTDTLRSGNKLDSTQEAFLRMHNIIK